MNRSRLILIAFVAFACILLAGCPKQVTVAEIQADPGRFSGKEVAIRGNVSNSFGALGQGAYELDDGTGRIWILVEQGGVPSKGARVRSQGQIVGGVSFAGRNFATALRESSHKVESDR
ncbi:MAG: hypothetical protein ACRD5W_00995 [Candidatus Acidiferrales bacterium]